MPAFHLCPVNTLACMWMRTYLLNFCRYLSAALKMPLAAWALSSRGQEERKMSSSFIMERMLEADTRAKESSSARLRRWKRKDECLRKRDILYLTFSNLLTVSSYLSLKWNKAIKGVSSTTQRKSERRGYKGWWITFQLFMFPLSRMKISEELSAALAAAAFVSIPFNGSEFYCCYKIYSMKIFYFLYHK